MAYNAGIIRLSCMTDLYLGEFEQVVVIAILRLDENAYAIAVREEIDKRPAGRLRVEHFTRCSASETP